jgi:hypothetical protein
MAAKKSDDDVVAVIIKCTNFAAIKHKNQRRQDPEKTPYINHPIGKTSFEQRGIIKYFKNKHVYLQI